MKQILGYEQGDNHVLDEHTDTVTSKPRPANEYKSRTFYRLLLNREEPREGSGDASTHHRKVHF
jgi:hypothetical protein